jgi:hypothetical protein
MTVTNLTLTAFNGSFRVTCDQIDTISSFIVVVSGRNSSGTILSPTVANFTATVHAAATPGTPVTINFSGTGNWPPPAGTVSYQIVITVTTSAGATSTGTYFYP